jgi:hypothetical protein
MTTIVVHGTQTHRSAIAGTWWWNSWHEGGFLEAVAQGMRHASGSHDVWRVNGVPVAQVSELTATRSFWSLSLRPRSLSQHEGHFLWSGAAMGVARDAAASALVAYLNAIRALTDEPIRIIAHSHGCNVVKMASASRSLAPGIYFERTAFLACPHFFTPNAAAGYQVPYKLAPGRFGRILNLYSPSDSVQVDVASHLSGQVITASIAEMQSPTAYRVEQDPDVRHLYENVEFAVAGGCSGTQAHTLAHSSLLGAPVGAWLASGATSAQALGSLYPGGALPPVPVTDDGA